MANSQQEEENLITTAQCQNRNVLAETIKDSIPSLITLRETTPKYLQVKVKVELHELKKIIVFIQINCSLIINVPSTFEVATIFC